jgi:hypothetical protein
LLDTAIDCAFGRAPPIWYAKERDAGFAEIVLGGTLIVNLTVPVTGDCDCPEAVRVTVKCPAYVPFGMAPGMTDTVKLVPNMPTEPLDGVTVIHGASSLTEKLASTVLEIVQIPDGTELPVYVKLRTQLLCALRAPPPAPRTATRRSQKEHAPDARLCPAPPAKSLIVLNVNRCLVA